MNFTFNEIVNKARRGYLYNGPDTVFSNKIFINSIGKFNFSRADGTHIAQTLRSPGDVGVRDSSQYVRLKRAAFGSSYKEGGIKKTEIFGDGKNIGFSVSISGDGTRLAVGAPNDDGDFPGSGVVRVYDFINNNWVQIGADISGEGEGDQSGLSVSLSKDGTRVAIGAPLNGIIGGAGHVRIYEFNGSQWVQLGSDIDGGVDESQGDALGSSVSLSENGDIVAIIASGGGIGAGAGHVRIYEFNGSQWVQLGSDILDGVGSGVFSIRSISLNNAGTRLAIGIPREFGDIDVNRLGLVRIYDFVHGDWVKFGNDIIDSTTISSGQSVSLNSDGTRLAVSANVRGGGSVIIYNIENAQFTQVGQKITNQDRRFLFGNSVSLNSAGDKVAIGIPPSVDTNLSGYVQVYTFNNTNWVQRGKDIEGDAGGDDYGLSVSLSNNGDILAIGAPQRFKEVVVGAPRPNFDGYARVNRFINNNWVKLGNDIS